MAHVVVAAGHKLDRRRLPCRAIPKSETWSSSQSLSDDVRGVRAPDNRALAASGKVKTWRRLERGHDGCCRQRECGGDKKGEHFVSSV